MNGAEVSFAPPRSPTLESVGAHLRHSMLLTVGVAWYAFVPWLKARLGRAPSPQIVGAQLRGFFEGGGLVYRKLGQFLAMRSDILPMAVCAELDHLFDEVPPMPFAVVRRLVERELGGRVEDLFTSIESDPISSASVAQVH